MILWKFGIYNSTPSLAAGGLKIYGLVLLFFEFKSKNIKLRVKMYLIFIIELKIINKKDYFNN